MEETNKKKKSFKSLFVIIAALIAAGGLTAAGLVFGPKLFKKPEEPIGPQDEEYIPLFWNVDRDYYLIQHPNESGLSSRKVQDDGFYHILFATENGRSAQRLVKDVRIMNKIDNNRCMALVTDEKGIVIDIQTLEDLGYEYVYDRYYVSEGDESRFLLDSSSNYNGMTEEMQVDGSFMMIDVSGFDEAESIIGNQLKYLRAEDRVVGIQNDEGKIRTFYVIERTELTPTYVKYCDYCFQDVKWKGWSSDSSLPLAAGHYNHYYLTHDVELKSAQVLKPDSHICVDLNGHTVNSAEGQRIYTLANVTSGLALFDYSEAQTGKLIGHGTFEGAGGVICLSKGNFQLYGGTIDASDVTQLTSGAAVYIAAGQTFKMYGGTIIGGHGLGNRYITSAYKEASRGGVAGSIVVIGRFEMYGGTVKDGMTDGEVYKTASGATARVSGYGGNIYLTKTGYFLMEGGVIENGTASCSGGNVYLGSSTDPENRATMVMNGGIIRGGKNTRDKFNCGNIQISTGALFTMNGGEIYGGVARNMGGNVYVNGTMIMNGGVIRDGVTMGNSDKASTDSVAANVFLVHPDNFTMTGGRINGYVYYVKQDNKGKVNLSGNPVIYGGKTNLNIANTMFVHAENMGSGAKIGITSSDFFTDQVSPAVKSAFIPDTPGLPISQYDGRLFFGDLRCVCGGALKGIGTHTCKPVAYKAWTSKTGLPTENGCYYLFNDVDMKTQASIQKDSTVNLDLNGKTVKSGENARIYITMNEKSNLRISDSVGGGKMIARGSDFKQDGNIAYCRYGFITLYAGTFDASQVVTVSGGAAFAAGAMSDNITMYGGEIIGGTSKCVTTVKDNGTYTSKGGYGGSVYVGKNARLTMYSGVIRDGISLSDHVTVTTNGVSSAKTTNGFAGNIYVEGGGTFEMKTIAGLVPPVVKDGKSEAAGGNLYVSGTATLAAGEISGGFAGYTSTVHTANGGNINEGASGTLVISGTKVLNGTAANCGGNIAANGDFKMTGGQISGGQTTEVGNSYAINGANLFETGNATVLKTIEFTGGTIDGNVAIYAASYPQTLKISGTPKILGTGLNIPAGQLFEVGTMKSGAEVHVTASGIFTKPTAEANKAFFKSNVSGMDVAVTDAKELVIGIVRCECGGVLAGETVNGEVHQCKNLIYGPWTSTTALPTTPGNYVLTNDVSVATQPSVTTAGTVRIDLNGHTVKSEKEDQRVFMVNNADAEVIITDSLGTGKMIANTTFKGEGGALLARRGKVTLIGLDIQGAKVTDNGGVIASYPEADLTVIGGTIHGGNAVKGGGIYGLTDSPIHLYGAEITGNTAATAGGVYANRSKLDLADGVKIIGNGIADAADNDSNLSLDTTVPATVTAPLTADAEIGVTATGLGIIAKGTENVTEAMADAFTADSDLYKVVAETDAGTVSFKYDNAIPPYEACECGGFLNGKTVNGVTHTCENLVYERWTSNTALPVTAGNYVLTEDVVLAIQPGVTTASKIRIDLNGHTVTASKEADRVYMINNADAEVIISDSAQTGKLIAFTTFKGDGGALLARRGKMTLIGIDVQGAKATGNGGVIMTYPEADLTIIGGKLHGGNAVKGGAIMANSNAAVHLYGVEITDNVSANGAVYAVGAKFDLADALKITGNGMTTAADNDSNLIVSIDGATKVVAALTEDAEIGITASGLGVFATGSTGVTEAMATAFVSDNDTFKVVAETNAGTVSFKLDNAIPPHVHCVCGGADLADHTCDDTTEWTAIATLNGLASLESGSYYLTQDCEITSQQTFNGKKFNICLNGHTVTFKNRILLGNTSAASLTITDCAETPGTLKYITSTEAMIYMNKCADVKIYGVNIDGSQATAKAGLFYVYGKEESSPKLTIVDSVIKGTPTHTLSTVLRTDGANDTRKATVEVTLKNVDITAGTSTGNGAAIYITGPFNAENVTITGATTTVGGAALYLAKSAKMVAKDIEITGNKAPKGGAIYMVEGATLDLSGKVTITGNGIAKPEDNDSNIFMEGTEKLAIANDLAADSVIGLGMKVPGVFAEIEGLDDDAMEAFRDSIEFTADPELAEITVKKKDGKLVCEFIGDSTIHRNHCVCGGLYEEECPEAVDHECEDVTWTELTDMNNIASLASGYYYLENDLVMTKAVLLNDKNIVICLNGHKITMGDDTTAARILLGNTKPATLTITDCTTDPDKVGTIEVVNVTQTAFYLHNYGTMNIYNGIIDGSTAKKVNNTTPMLINMGARAATAYAIGTFNLYGGTLIGFDMPALGITAKANGATLRIYGYRTANIYGGVMKDGVATDGGGNICVEANATLNLYGGEISGGTALRGGNIYVTGTVHAKDAVIKDGTATSTSEGGGNIIVNSTATATFENCEISGGTAALQGGNIRHFGKVTLKDTLIKDGSSKQLGAGVYTGTHANSKLTLVGAVVFENNMRELANGTKAADGLYIDSAIGAEKVDLSGLTAEANIGIRSSETDLNEIASGLAAGFENVVFKSESPLFTIVNNGGKVKLQKK